jgi:hypothetical protein
VTALSRTKNGPALAGYGAVTMKNALAATMSALPEQLRRSLTWDRGKELSAHVAFKVETGIPVYFADPQSPWQRGTRYGPRTRSRQSPTRSTAGPARPSAGRPRPKLSRSTYARSNQPVLRRSIEPDQFRARKVHRALAHHGLVGSMGQVGSAGDNADMESFFALLQRNVLDRRRWTTRDELRIAIVTWIERTYHRRRRQTALVRLTPIEYGMINTPPATLAA